MKRKIEHMKNETNTEQTVARLIQIIDAELARGEEADEQLILECTAYLQELSPETAIPAEVTERYLQAELTGAEIAPSTARRRAPRVALKVSLRFAAVIMALALFCVAVPVMAVQTLNETGHSDIANDLMKPVLKILTHATESESIDYPHIDEYERKAGYTATYKSTKEMLIKEQPADILCLDDLPESLGKYEIRVIHHGRNNGDQWRINWSSKDNRWGYLVSYTNTRALPRDLSRIDYETAYERHTVNGRTYFYKMNADGSYWATCIQGRLQYSVLAPDIETMTLLIDHTAYASEIVSSANETLPLLTPEQYSPLDRYPDPYGHFQQYIAYYETTEDFLKTECVDILTVNDQAAELGDFWIRVTSHARAIAI